MRVMRLLPAGIDAALFGDRTSPKSKSGVHCLTDWDRSWSRAARLEGALHEPIQIFQGGHCVLRYRLPCLSSRMIEKRTDQ
jgi:hypothetical protein